MVSEHVYKELTELKKPGQSYTKVIDSFLHPQKPKKSFMEFAGAWSFMSEKRARQIEKTARKVRKNWRKVPKW